MIFQNLLIRRLSLALAFLVISCTSVLADNLPPVLLADAEKHSCEEVADFYDRKVFAAPFVYGYSDESDGRTKFIHESAAVYWCRTKDKQKYEKYYLIVYSQHQKPNGCPKKVIETGNPPGGLSLFQDKQFFEYYVGLNFSDFTFVDTWGKTVESAPEVDVDGLTGQFIMSARSGSADIFYCYQGRWVGVYLH